MRLIPVPSGWLLDSYVVRVRIRNICVTKDVLAIYKRFFSSNTCSLGFCTVKHMWKSELLAKYSTLNHISLKSNEIHQQHATCSGLYGLTHAMGMLGSHRVGYCAATCHVPNR